MSAAIQLIVGLGNPGSEYEKTRHNAGFFLVERLAQLYHRQLKRENKFHGSVAKVSIEGHNVWLLKPSTFMNRSGQAVAALAKFYKIAPEAILIAHDELDLEPGTVRLKRGGGHGGHNGLCDTMAQLGGSKTFQRLRIGIGHPGHASKVSNYVLSRAGKGDQQQIDDAIEHAIQIIPLVVNGEDQQAMNLLHSSR